MINCASTFQIFPMALLIHMHTPSREQLFFFWMSISPLFQTSSIRRV